MTLSYLKSALNPVPVCIYLLLILSSLYVLPEYLEDILTLLNPLFDLGGPAIVEYPVCESGIIIPIQSLERGRPMVIWWVVL